MRTSLTVKVEDMEQAMAEMPTHNVKQRLEEEICEMIEARTVEVDLSDNPLVHQHYKGYIMALEDLWYRLYGTQLDIGQDIDPVDQEDTF